MRVCVCVCVRERERERERDDHSQLTKIEEECKTTLSTANFL